MPQTDPHSYTDPSQGIITSVQLNLDVDFTSKQILGRVELTLSEPSSSGALNLDTRDLDIKSIHTDKGATTWTLSEKDPVMGSCLTIILPDGTQTIGIVYTTSPDASALQWLEPSQTAGGKHPYLFTQCQAIHARSIIPIQDSPSVRFVFAASITVPEDLVAVMAAAPGERVERMLEQTVTYSFEMPQPVPAYLLAFAVGNITHQDLGPRSRVYTEPEMLEAAAWEFAEIDAMLQTAEELFGPYRWDRYDFLVMPPSFPYGGMENPRLTFLTPTLLAGDRSQVRVLAHELSHAWTGNLVTSATMEHFWLNEGMTKWGERRILERIIGTENVILQCALSRRTLERDLERFGPDSPLTRLRTDLAGLNPDEIYSYIPYEKGFLLMKLLEDTAGRDAFDMFMRTYMDTFAFQSLTTEQFLIFLEEHLPGLAEEVGAEEWIYQSGLPANAPTFSSAKLENVERFAKAFVDGVKPSTEEVGNWSAEEILIYLNDIPHQLSHRDCAWIDRTFGLSEIGNADIKSVWLRKVASSAYAPAIPQIGVFLEKVGRMVLIRQVYEAVAEISQEEAGRLYALYREHYHPITQTMIKNILKG